MQEQTKTFSISGRIRNEHDEGIFGLRVVAYDNDLLFDDRLGASVTAEDGSFRLHYTETDFRDLFEAKPDVYIEVFDCTGKKVYSSAKATEWQAGAEVQIDAIIPDVKLEEHFEKSRPLARLHGGLVASEKLAAIDAAAELLQSRIDQGVMPPLGGMGRPPKLRNMIPLSAAYCPAPDILGFDDILDTVWGVHYNDPRVRTVFEDILDTVFYRFRVRAPHVAAAASKDWAEDRPLEFEVLTELFKAKRETLSTGPTDTLIERDRLIPVIVAAVIAAGGDRVVENRYLGILLGQFGALYQLDKVYRAARGALASNPHGIPGFAHLLGHVGGTCGPADGPIPFPPRRDDLWDINEILRLEMIQCAAEMVQASRSGALAGGTYEILTADWSDGCPGSPVVLTGTNFEGLFPDRNRVVFTHQNGIETIPVAPASPSDWTDTRIEVALPADTGPGPVSLSIVGNYASVCGKAILPPRRGNTMAFSGGTAFIRRFTADHRDGSFTVTPGDTVTLRWVVVPSNANVHLHVVQDGVVIVDENMPAEGSRDIAIPAGILSETVCTLTADNACPGSDTRTITLTGCEIAELAIDGIEVTQAIQHYRSADHLTDAADVEADNSAQIVADKPAWVRVYLRSGLPVSFNGGQLPDVDGSLVIDRRVGGVWSNVTTLNAVNAPVTAEESFPTIQLERGDNNASLNFIIPANVMTGLLRLTVTVSSAAQCAGLAATDSVTVDVNLQQQLQVAALRIGYDGLNAAGTANVRHPAPPLNGAVNSVAAECDFALTIYPVSSALNLRDLGTEDATAPLINPPLPGSGGCDTNWSPIIGLVANARTNDGNQAGWIYYGFVTDNIPLTHGNNGCASGTNAAGVVGTDGRTFAHEAGHQMGMPHSPCGKVGTPNAGYPMYEPYDTGATSVDAADGATVYEDASTGEYGLDINNGDIFAPDTCEDFMSYCGPRWVSLYSHTYMCNNSTLNPTSLATGFTGTMAGMVGGSGAWKDVGSNEPRPRITITGYIDADGNVSVSNVARMNVQPPLMNGEVTTYEAQLIGESGKPVSTAPVFTLPHRFHEFGRPHGGTIIPKRDRGPFHFIAVMGDVEDGKTLQIVREEEVVWRKDRPASKPKLNPVKASLTKDNRLELSWNFEVPPENDAQIWLRWSHDQGKTWNGLAVNRRGTSATLPINGLPVGMLTFQVVAHDGFHSVSAESQAVNVPERAPLLSILHPREGTPVTASLPLRLLASATMRSGNTLTDEQFVWYVGGQEVGRGRDIWVANPGPGEHEIRLVAEDPAGTAEVRTTFEVR